MNRYLNPHKITADFEQALCDYTGSPYCVAVNSCTNALLLCCAYLKVKNVTIPRKTYCGVPQSIIHAGGTVSYEDKDWEKYYQLKPYPIFDSALTLHRQMYQLIDHETFSQHYSAFVCLSFHWTKPLSIGSGGAILCPDKESYEILKKLRFDGRTECVEPNNDNIILGYHCNMTPAISAEGITRLRLLPKFPDSTPKGDYGDLSECNFNN